MKRAVSLLLTSAAPVIGSNIQFTAGTASAELELQNNGALFTKASSFVVVDPATNEQVLSASSAGLKVNKFIGREVHNLANKCPTNNTPQAVDVGENTVVICGNTATQGGVVIDGFTDVKKGQIWRVMKLSSGGSLTIKPNVRRAGVGYIVTHDWSEYTIPSGEYGSFEFMCTNDASSDFVIHITSSSRSTAEPGSETSPGESCKELRAKGLDTSGKYWIDPTGTSKFEAYCDMETDGGGYTLVGSWAKESGYAMANNAAGYRVADVKDNHHAPRAGLGPAHYSQADINALFNGGDSTYLSLVGGCQSSQAGVLSKQVKNTPAANFDAFRAVYDTAHMLASGFTSSAQLFTANANPLPLASSSFSSYATKGRSCSGVSGNCYHYLPDDLTGGCHWLFRENSDNAPFDSGDSYVISSNIPSLLFIR